jgi:acyl-coenzyme A thioesterase PaaI-like protein
MSFLGDAVRAAKETGSFEPLYASIPYLAFLGFSLEPRAGELLGKLTYADPLVGNPAIPALHGGAIGGMLESTAIFSALLDSETPVMPKIVTITIDYLRTGRPVDTFAKASITRQGRRVANVGVEAWQEDRARPIARANVIFLLEPL